MDAESDLHVGHHACMHARPAWRGHADTGCACVRQAEEGAAKAGSVLDKIKDALPFGTLPTFELAVSADDANMGPNEVDKKLLGSFPGSNNPFDKATPGEGRA